MNRCQNCGALMVCDKCKVSVDPPHHKPPTSITPQLPEELSPYFYQAKDASTPLEAQHHNAINQIIRYLKDKE